MARPEIHAGMSAEEFTNNYYLKSELIDFCKREGLSAYGGKPDLTERIAHYLSTGNELPAERERRSRPPEAFTLDTVIEDNITCSERHRAFFKSQIGEGFKYNVEFLQWLRKNSGKTYADAVEQFHVIAEHKKRNRTKIGKQFEYNTYVRDFFDNNKGLKLEDAIRCWRYKKSIPGHNRYEESDKIALEDKHDQQSENGADHRA